MTSYEPPTANVPIFDTLLFFDQDEPLTYNTASRFFLKYPLAQGTENLLNTNINGTLSITGRTNQTLIGLGSIQYGDSLSLQNATSLAQNNTIIGKNSGLNITDGQANTFIGQGVGTSITTGVQSTGIGRNVFGSSTANFSNSTAVGDSCLQRNNVGQVCGFGVQAGNNAQNSQGSNFFGFQAGFNQTNVALADSNNIFGHTALYSNQTGGRNSAFGYRALYNTLNSSENVGIGSLALEDNLTGSQNTSIGYTSGRHSTLGSNGTYLGHNTGQLSSDSTTYNYLTCIGSTSGREAGVCSSNRMIFGSTNGNEDYLYAGSGDFLHRDSTKTLNLFTSQSGSINIGLPTSTNGVYIGNFRSYRSGSDYVFQNTSGATQFQGQPTGTLQIGTNQTFGNITIGAQSSTNGGSLTISSANGPITIGGTNLTTQNINIGTSLTSGTSVNIGPNNNSSFAGVNCSGIILRKVSATDFAIRSTQITGEFRIGDTQTTGDIDIGTGQTTGSVVLGSSTAGTGSIVCNRNISLPPTSSYSTPVFGQLGFNTNISITATTNVSTGQSSLPNNATNITQFSNAFQFPNTGTYLCNVQAVMNRTGTTGGVSCRIGVSLATTSVLDQNSTIQFYTGNTAGAAQILPLTFSCVLNITSTGTNYYIVGNTGLATSTDQVSLTSCNFYITRIA